MTMQTTTSRRARGFLALLLLASFIFLSSWQEVKLVRFPTSGADQSHLSRGEENASLATRIITSPNSQTPKLPNASTSPIPLASSANTNQLEISSPPLGSQFDETSQFHNYTRNGLDSTKGPHWLWNSSFMQSSFNVHVPLECRDSVAAATIVSAYWKVPNKHGHEEFFVPHLKHLSKVETPLVIFTDINLDEIIEKGGPCTIIVSRPFQEIPVWRRYEAHLRKQQSLDPELQETHEWRPNHTPELYAVWHSKIQVMHEVAAANPFDTECFMWLDVDGFMNELGKRKKRPNWPRERGGGRHSLEDFVRNWPSMARIDILLSPGRVLFNQLAPLNRLQKKEAQRGVIRTLTGNETDELGLRSGWFITSNIFVCRRAMALELAPLYFEMLEEVMSRNRFVGTEQTALDYLCLTRPTMCALVGPDKCSLKGFLSKFNRLTYTLHDKGCMSNVTDPFGNVLVSS